MRPRNALIAACPWLSRDGASEALRDAGGDVEKAKRAVSAARRRCQETDGECDGRESSSKKTAAATSVGRSSSDDNAHDNAHDDAGSSQTQIGGDNNEKPPSSPLVRAPPRHAVSINNLSDRQYCCVWGVEVFEDGYRPDVARTLLASVARHVNPILRDRGWRVKRLIESASSQWIGLCTSNGRADADAASTNIQLNLRVRPDRRCTQFRTFHQILAVMLHEITHTSIGLEDIHPPAFYELLDEIKVEYRKKLAAGEHNLETDDYGCKGQFISSSGELASVASSASDILGNNGVNNLGLLGTEGSEGDCGASKKRRRHRGKWKKRNNKSSTGYTSNIPQKEKKRPLLKGSKMIDKRTRVGKASMVERENLTSRELAAKAALARFGNAGAASSAAKANASSAQAQEITFIDDGSSDDCEDGTKPPKNGKRDASAGDEDEESIDDDDEPIQEHNTGCGCRSCDWSKLFLLE
ncbi:hypothetical protein ACHAXR_013268 [Thalassiosira sp. AJA248-18]